MELSLLPLAFSPSLTVASRLLHPYNIEDKISRLMVKQFSIARDTQKDSQSYTGKRRGKREIEVAWRRTGGVKRRKNNQTSNQFP